jgi:hypothetical protein
MDFLLGLFRDDNTNTALAAIIACSGGFGQLAATVGLDTRHHAGLDTRKFTQPAQTGRQHLAVPESAAASLIEVTNALPQPSHDQA